MGGYSLNRHKHLQSGEGGLVVTENPIFAERLRAFRNHGEVAASEVTLDSGYIYGHNWRLGEVEALIAYMQYRKFEDHIMARRNTGAKLAKALQGIDGLVIPEMEKETSHDYYILGMRLQKGKNRDFISSALQAEGLSNLITAYSGLENLPAFKPFNPDLLPNAQLLNNQVFIGMYLAGHQYDEELISQISAAFRSVFSDKRSNL
jgi:dTDP-4-amino-4,6-dideoxygalactose transaminase